MAHRVFVFGTLKEGFPNFPVNRGARVAGNYRTLERFPLYLVGERHVPWMLDQRGVGEQVAGELYEVDDGALAAMDRLERVGEPDGYRRVAITVVCADGAQRVFVYLKSAHHLVAGDARIGPLAEYTLEHARLYRARAAPIRGVTFDLFHTLTARESEWSSHPATYKLLGVDQRAWDRVLIETSRWRLVGEERDPFTILRRLVTDVGAGLCDAGRAKPEPEIFRACLDALGLEAGECVFVGDGGSDELRGAKAIGLRTIFVSGVIEELFPERVAARAAIADHHVRTAPEVLEVLA